MRVTVQLQMAPRRRKRAGKSQRAAPGAHYAAPEVPIHAHHSTKRRYPNTCSGRRISWPAEAPPTPISQAQVEAKIWVLEPPFAGQERVEEPGVEPFDGRIASNPAEHVDGADTAPTTITENPALAPSTLPIQKQKRSHRDRAFFVPANSAVNAT